MSCVFQNIDPPSPPGEGRTHSPGGEGGGGSIFRKTQDTALYSTYIESSLLRQHRRSLFSVSLKVDGNEK